MQCRHTGTYSGSDGMKQITMLHKEWRKVHKECRKVHKGCRKRDGDKERFPFVLRLGDHSSDLEAIS